VTERRFLMATSEDIGDLDYSRLERGPGRRGAYRIPGQRLPGLLTPLGTRSGCLAVSGRGRATSRRT